MTPTLPGPRIGLGRTAEVFAWEPHQVLKLFYEGCPPAWSTNELTIGRLIAPLPLPTPKLLGTVTLNNRPGLIYERVDGVSMFHLSNAKPWRLVPLARQLAELHTEIHKYPGTGLPSERDAFFEMLQLTPDLPTHLKPRLLSLAEKLPDGNALCHFDFHPDQVLVTAKGLVVVDWMTAQQSHPLADVARTAVILSVGRVPYGGPTKQLITHLWRRAFLRTYLARYLELHPGVTQNEIRLWMIPLAAGRLNERIAGEKEPLLNLIESYLSIPKISNFCN